MLVVKLAAVLKARSWRHAREVLRIERQVPLQTLDRVGHEHAEGAERQQRERVRLPILLFPRIDAEQAVEGVLDAAEPAAERRVAPLEDPKHVSADRLRDRQDEREEDENLNPAYERHVEIPFAPLEPFGAYERIEQVAGQHERQDRA